MNLNDSIEVTAPTIERAINQALAQLGADQDDVNIEVLSTPRAGVLGLGVRPARVRVTRRAPEGASTGVTSPPPAPPITRDTNPAPARPVAPALARPVAPAPARPVAPAPARPVAPAPARPVAPQASLSSGVVEEPTASPAPLSITVETTEIDPEGEIEEKIEGAKEPSLRADRVEPAALAREAAEVLTRILDLMGEAAKIEIVDDSTAENIELNIKGDGSGLLIGRHGQTLDALEYIVNRILARKLKEAAEPVSIDTESYRARRRRQLHRMALAKGEQAKREHLAVALEPMPPRDRRIIHLALKDDPLVTTRSSGEGFLRSVEIMPVDERSEGANARRRDRRLEQGRETGRDLERTSLGQQGGFKHGQKRIV
jgi:spoIIIJ-associated protein